MDDRADAPLITAIILTWNSRGHVGRCLDTLERTAAGMPVEVFVVDNGSTDGTADIVAARSPATRFAAFHLIRLATNRGTTWSRNLAIRQSRGRYLLVLDADAEVLPGAVETLVGEVRDQARVGIVGPRLLGPDGSTQPGCKRFPTLRTKILKVLPGAQPQGLARDDELYAQALYEGDAVRDVDYCISAAWLVNVAAVREVGLLDEQIFYAPEDVDYCLRMWQQGWRVRYHPGARVIHHTQRASYRSVRMMLLHAWGLVHHFRKHRYLWSRESLYRRLPRGTSV